ncbi:hypothetical protein PAXRUDRAFT_835480 [Paxillus rubicundulus Ve08.2h10]|uniref:Uncharacterized protein n=1 Tax=Paxillus rubicundulus Ve08.2h10 TaxID=930991 RepID=A0A0D0D6U2_9AGAM|nr:hypothetical protein PAXRUDRAFT_835529 [Paxillus rubicundulus Ve08.2h10]KIK76046.1 hypothetical protein PAXRUDRAFT_835480 [Paxillus rubicundulus Ve08.2h10]
MRATTIREVALIFREYARKIHDKAKPQDPNFLRVSVMCCKVAMPCIRFVGCLCCLSDRAVVRANYPSFAIAGENGVTYDWSDKRTAVVRIEEKRAMQKHFANASRSEPEMFTWNPTSSVPSFWFLVSVLVSFIPF